MALMQKDVLQIAFQNHVHAHIEYIKCTSHNVPILHVGIEASLVLSNGIILSKLKQKERLYRTSWKHIEHAQYTSKIVAILHVRIENPFMLSNGITS